MPVVLAGATSGSTTIQATDAVTATLTLPSSTGTLLSTASPASGNVIQVVQVVAYTQQSTTSNTYTDMTGMSLSITPKFSTSKILAIVNVNGILSSTSNTGLQTRLLRGSTAISYGDCYATYHAAALDADMGSVVMQILDTPATTSSTTYKVQFRTRTAGNTVNVNLNDSPSSSTQLDPSSTNSAITLLEIAG